MDNPDEYMIYKIIESLIYTLYLFFVFLSIQIFLLWKDIDKKIVKSIITGSFIRKNCLYLFSFSIFFILFDLSDSIKQLDVYSGVLKVLAPFTLVLVSYEWYSKLRPRVCKLLPGELTNFKHCSQLPQVKLE